MCEFHWSLQEDFCKEKGTEIRKYYLYFQSIPKEFYICSISYFSFYFSLNEYRYIKALRSVYFLERIIWLYVYCKYIKSTIFVFNELFWLLFTNLWWNMFSHTERHAQQPNIIYQCYRSVAMPTALRLHFSMAALDKPSNSCWHIWPSNSCMVELFTSLMFHFTVTTQSALCSTLRCVCWYAPSHTDQKAHRSGSPEGDNVEKTHTRLYYLFKPSENLTQR